MTRPRRDLATITVIVAVIVASLTVVRVTAHSAATDPPPAAPAAEPPPTGIATLGPDAAPTAAPDPPTSTAPAAQLPTGVAPSPAVPGPAATMILSGGVPVAPRADLTSRTLRPAGTAPADAAVTAPVDEPPADTFVDPARVATGWLNALCWYDYRGDRTDNIRRAARYGSTAMPAGQDPWTLDDRAWAVIITGRLSSACTGITATVEPVTHNGTADQSWTVRLAAAQILSADGVPFQAAPVTVTRGISQDRSGRWSIGPPVTAN